MNGFHVWDLNDDVQRYKNYIGRCVGSTPFHLAEYLLAEAQAEDGVTRFLYMRKRECLRWFQKWSEG